jgi:hypothetical protein
LEHLQAPYGTKWSNAGINTCPSGMTHSFAIKLTISFGNLRHSLFYDKHCAIYKNICIFLDVCGLSRLVNQPINISLL